MESVDKQSLPVICGACCAFTLLLTRFDECMGCAGKSECLCCGTSWCCKPNAHPIRSEKQYDQLCMLDCYLCGAYLQYPKTCIKGLAQCFCCVESIAFPCDETMPCVVNICLFNLYPKVGCNVKYGEIENTGVCRWLAPSYKVAASG
jgi:hypothetical protein